MALFVNFGVLGSLMEVAEGFVIEEFLKVLFITSLVWDFKFIK